MLEQQEHFNYWAKQLENSRPAQLLYDKPRSDDAGTRETRSSGTALVHTVIDGALYDDLAQYCKAHQVDPCVVLLAAFRTTHFRFTGSQDATLGLVQCGRLQCIRTTIDEETFEQIVRQVDTTMREAACHNKVAFQDIVGGVSHKQSSVVRMLFAMQSVLGKTESTESMGGMPWDVKMCVSQVEQSYHLQVEFATDLFYSETIEAVMAVLAEILRHGLQDPSAPVVTLPLTGCLPPWPELEKLHHRRTPYARDSSLMDLFRAQAKSCAEVVAVKDSSSQITYAQLDQLSDQLAIWLLARGLEPEALVGLFVPRSCQTIVAIFGILKAKLAYVPLDIDVPVGRAEAILSQIAGEKLVLVGDGAPAFHLDREDVEIVLLADVFEELKRSSATPRKGTTILDGPSATNLSHIFFTSGSTGRPKGVMTQHRNVVRLIFQNDLTSLIHRGTRMAHIANVASDMSTTEIWAPLLNGATLVCIDTMTVLDTARFYQTVLQEDIRFIRFTPTLLHQCLIETPDIFVPLEFLLIGGDRLDPRDARKLMACSRAAAFNIYGPTETTGFAAWYRIGKKDIFANGVPLGRNVDNAGLFVMDLKQRPVPNGVIGELIIVGDGLARSFLDPSQNEGRFVDLSVEGQSIRAYRTGDSVRRRVSDGQLEFFGRIDHQIKIRGHRVELGEVEHILSTSSLVDEAVVVLKQESDADDQRLVSFVTLIQHEELDQPLRNGNVDVQDDAESPPVVENIRRHLQHQLPAHMIPSEIIVIDKMPINANRKVDRKALTERAAKPHQTTPSTRPKALPRNYVERSVREEFSAVLGFEVGIRDNFFDLGGHSLMATMLVSRIRKRFEASLSVKDLFDHPTVVGLSRKILPGLGLAPYSPIPRLAQEGPVKQSLAQRRLWFMEQFDPGSTRYLLTYAWRLRGALDVDALQSALHALEKRHATLRTTFDQEEDGETQTVHPFSATPITATAISSPAALDAALQQEHSKTFDLEESPGWRVALYRLDEQEHVLSLVIHHIIADDWSIDILRRELGIFYSAAVKGQDPLSQVEALPIQYQDFSAWEKGEEQSVQRGQHLQYWSKQLQGSQPAQWPCDKRRPAELSEATGQVRVVIESALFEDLRRFCRVQRTTMFAALLGAFRVTHFRMTGQRDATIGILNACRDRQELEGLIGFFVNLQCIRTIVDAEEPFADLVRRVQATTTAAFLNQDVPFEQVVAQVSPDNRDGSQNPLVQTVFTFHPQLDLGTLTLPGLIAEELDTSRPIKFDMEFHLYLRQHSLEGKILFSKDLFLSETIEKLVSQFYEILQLGVARKNESDIAIR